MDESLEKKKVMLCTSWVSTIGNAILSIGKIIVGFISGSMAVLSDGIDSASDVIISLVMLFTSRIVSRPPDAKYAFGYERAESVATKILSFVIFYAGTQMLITTIASLFSDEPKEFPQAIAIYITIISIIGKFLLAGYQYKQGNKINSSMLKANALNMRNDIIISAGVLIGLVFTFVLKLPILDTVTGLIISIFIIRSAIKIFIDANIELMDGVKDISIYEKIFEAVEKVPGASNPHRVRSRQLGNMYMIALDVEADSSISLKEAHDIATAVEKSIKETIDNVYDIVVHIEPQGVHHPLEKFGIDKNLFQE